MVDELNVERDGQKVEQLKSLFSDGVRSLITTRREDTFDWANEDGDLTSLHTFVLLASSNCFLGGTCTIFRVSVRAWSFIYRYQSWAESGGLCVEATRCARYCLVLSNLCFKNVGHKDEIWCSGSGEELGDYPEGNIIKRPTLLFFFSFLFYFLLYSGLMTFLSAQIYAPLSQLINTYVVMINP